MTYSDKLKDPRWQRKRLEILNRDDFKCFWCGDKDNTLHVHHEYYEGDPWDVDNDGLTTLCSECHSVNHLKLTGLEKLLINSYRSSERGNMEMIKMLNRVVTREKTQTN